MLFGYFVLALLPILWLIVAMSYRMIPNRYKLIKLINII